MIIRINKLQLGLATVALAASVWNSSAIAGDINNGRKQYATYCAACHGGDGTSVMPGAPSFRLGERLMRPDMMLRATIQSGKNACPSFQGILNDQNIMDVISFIRTLG